MRQYNVASDLVLVKPIEPIVYKQYDNGDKLDVELYQDNEKIILTDEIVLAFFQLEDGTVIQKNCVIEDGNAIATLDNNILSISGTIRVEFTIYDGDKETTTRTLLITVESSINRNEAIETVPQWDIVSQIIVEGQGIIEAAQQVTEEATVAETIRNTAENDRITAESERANAESDRESAELSRMNAEISRAESETARQTAETARVAAEQERQTNTTTAIQNAETATTEATEATNAINLVLPNVINLEYIAPYSATTQYEKNNIVRHGKNSYIALQDTLGNEPTGTIDSPFWGVLAVGGIDGLGSVVSVNGVEPDEDGNVTIVIPDPDLSAYVKKEELEEGLPVLVTINRGVQVVNVPIGSPVNVMNFVGKTIINYVPLFDSGTWTFGAKITVDSSNKITIDASTAVNYVAESLSINSVENKDWTLSAIVGGGANTRLVALFYNSSNSLLSSTNSKNEVLNFKTPVGTSYFKVRCDNDTTIGTFTFENLMLNEGSTVQEFVANIKGVTNPTITVKGKNLFDKQRVTKDKYVKSDTGTTVNLIGAYASDFIRVNEGETYTRTGINNDSSAFYNKDRVYISTAGTNSLITVPTGAKYLRVTVLEANLETAQLEKGSVSTEFEPYREESLTVLGTFHEGDVVNGDIITRKKKEIVLDGSLAWEYVMSKTGFKQLRAKIDTDSLPAKELMVKYNGKILEYNGSEPTKADQFVLYQGYIYVSVDNTDSGWGSYTPTQSEMQAYFTGWRMGENISQFPLYNGTGVKVWYYFNDSGGKTGGTTVLPTTQSPDTKWQPYRLIYDLAESVTEQVKTIGSLTLAKGDNTVELTEGRIVRERVIPVKHALNKEWYINESGLSTNVEDRPTKYKIGSNSLVYKNGVLDSSWLVGPNEGVNGKLRYTTTEPDPTAIYEVEYIPLEPYKVSAYANPITIEYQDTLGSVVNLNVEDIAKIKSRMSGNESVMNELISNASNYAKKTQEDWKTAVLQNGWTGTLRYFKDEFDIVHIKGSVVSGTITLSTILTTLPVGYRPKDHPVPITGIRSNDGSNVNSPIGTDGSLRLGIFTGAGTFQLNSSFKAEQ